MDAEQRKQVGAQIRAARKAKGWSQTRLAEEAGVSENTVLSIELAKRQPQDTKLTSILRALDMPEPADGILSLEGVPEDVRIFVDVAMRRLKLMEPVDRQRVLADIYPRLLLDES